jgi:hypothetical protein
MIPILEEAAKKTRLLRHSLYGIFCGTLYILKNGRQWMSIPHDFPPCQTHISGNGKSGEGQAIEL